MSDATIEVYENEARRFPPPETFVAAALVSDRSLYEEAEADYEAFWARQARELLTWNQDFDTTFDWDLPFAQWFVGGKLNVSENCLDRHVAAGRGDKVAYHWEGEPGDTRTITYAELLADVEKFANVLKGFGLATGDRVAIYMPMIPELPVAMLACTRIGVAHSVIFGGFSPDADRRSLRRRRGQADHHRRRRVRGEVLRRRLKSDGRRGPGRRRTDGRTRGRRQSLRHRSPPWSRVATTGGTT